MVLRLFFLYAYWVAKVSLSGFVIYSVFIWFSMVLIALFAGWIPVSTVTEFHCGVPRYPYTHRQAWLSSVLFDLLLVGSQRQRERTACVCTVHY